MRTHICIYMYTILYRYTRRRFVQDTNYLLNAKKTCYLLDFVRGFFTGFGGLFPPKKKVNDQRRCAGPIPFCEFCEYARFRRGNFLKFEALCIFVLLFACMYALNLCMFVTIFVYVGVHIRMCTRTRISYYICEYIYLCVCTCTHTHCYLHVCTVFVYARVHIRTREGRRRRA
jgi:hypothetical protein